MDDQKQESQKRSSKPSRPGEKEVEKSSAEKQTGGKPKHTVQQHKDDPRWAPESGEPRDKQ